MNRLCRLAMLSTAVIGFSNPVAYAQSTFDVRSKCKIHYGVVGTGHFTVSSMKIPFQLSNAGSYDDFVTKAMSNLVATYTNSDTKGTYQDAAQDITGASGIAADLGLAAIWEGFALIVGVCQAENNAFNSYTFFCPADATYQISAHLTGAIDKPRNRVILSGPEGQNQLDDDNPSSSLDKTYVVQMSRGIHTLTVALGSGWSATWHNAGTLNWVQMNNAVPVSWTDPIDVAQGNSLVYYDMPSVGNTVNKTFVSNIPADHDFTNIINGTARVDSFVSVGAITPAIDYKISLNIKNCLGNTKELPASFINAHSTFEPVPYFVQNGNAISLFLSATRLADTIDSGTYEVCAQ